jgi:hypothetical protein
MHKSNVAMGVLMGVICLRTHGAAGKLSDSRLQTRDICYSNSSLNVASSARRHPHSFDIHSIISLTKPHNRPVP